MSSKQTTANTSTRKKASIQSFTNFKQIGHGAFGRVYQATYKNNEKEFALKKISKKQIKSKNMMTQISNEIQISKKLEHPHIIKLWEYFQEENDIFLVLELAKGGQLYTKLMKIGRFDQSQTRKMVKQIISALKYLHNNKIIHRDIKPQNILLDKKGNVKLADFGWSNFTGTGERPRMTYCGTVDYLAPEMIDKSGHDQKLDIWCLGVLVYELLTGRTPFVSQDAKGPQKKKQIQQNILNMNINFPADFPTLAKSFVMGMIKRNPKERLSLEQIEAHQWLKQSKQQNGDELSVMQKKPAKEFINIDSSNNDVINQLKKKNKDLEDEIQLLKINSQMRQEGKGDNNEEQINNLLKQVRRLKPLQQKINTVQKDYDELWEDSSKKDKEIILLKAEVKRVDDIKEECERVKADKKRYEQKAKKYQKQLKETKQRQLDIKEELNQISCNVGNKIKNGHRLDVSDVQSPEFVEYLQQELEILGKKFEQSKKVLLKVLDKEKISKEKQEELGKLRAQQKDMKQVLKAQLKQEFENQKDQIFINARKQLSQQRDRWMQERERLKRIYEQGQNSTSDQGLGLGNKQSQLELQLNTIKQLNDYYEKTISEQKFRIKDLQSQLTRKK